MQTSLVERLVKRVRRTVKGKPKRTGLTPFGQRIKARNYYLYQEKHEGIHSGEACSGTFLTQDVPLSRWHCCPLWQRKLDNKWNSREFAVRFGYRVPELYWHGRYIEDLDFGELPDHYVIRPTMGWASRGVFVMSNGVNLMDKKRYGEEEIRRSLSKLLTANPLTQILVEEFVKTEEGKYQLPNEYKCFVFDGNVAAVHLIRRKTLKDAKTRAYDKDWQPLVQFSTLYPSDEPIAPPRCLDEMLTAARTLGKAYGAFVRIDFYATDKGCVFGEFTPTPALGVGYTDYASQYYEKWWRETYPDPNPSDRVLLVPNGMSLT